jgi:hypothetical protein
MAPQDGLADVAAQERYRAMLVLENFGRNRNMA